MCQTLATSWLALVPWGVLKNVSVIWVWCYILAIPALGREKQEDQKFKVIPSYLVSSGCSMK